MLDKQRQTHDDLAKRASLPIVARNAYVLQLLWVVVKLIHSIPGGRVTS